MAGNGGVEPSGVASPCGDAAWGEGTKKDGGTVLDGRGAKDAGGTTRDSREKLKSLKFRKSFRLQATNGETVMEGIHSLFASQGAAAPKSGTAAMEKTRRGRAPESGTADTWTTRGGRRGRTGRGNEDKIAKTSVFMPEIGKMGPQIDEGPWAKVGLRVDEGAQAEARQRNDAWGWGDAGIGEGAKSWAVAGPLTMATLEEAVRERLGLCWMRRAGRRQKPA